MIIKTMKIEITLFITMLEHLILDKRFEYGLFVRCKLHNYNIITPDDLVKSQNKILIYSTINILNVGDKVVNECIYLLSLQ